MKKEEEISEKKTQRSNGGGVGSSGSGSGGSGALGGSGSGARTVVVPSSRTLYRSSSEDKVGEKRKEKTPFLERLKDRLLPRAKGDRSLPELHRHSGPGSAALDMHSWLSPYVRNQPYFHGMIHKDEVPAMLEKDGDFILRLGRAKISSQNVTLSVHWHGRPRHFILNRDPNGKVFIDPARRFRDEVGLVEWYRDHNQPLSFNGYLLRNPVTRQSWELEKKDIHLTTELGKGAFGKVYTGLLEPRALPTRNGAAKPRQSVPVAVKLCESTGLNLEAQNVFMKEAEIGRRYDHPNIIKVYGVQHREQPLMIVMELATGGSLLHFLHKERSLVEADLTRLARDAAAALEFLAIKKVLHRDIAARNFLLGSPPDRVLKIADFGLAKADCVDYTMQTKIKLAIRWLAPEVLLHGHFSLASEMWSFGVLCWEIWTRGGEPFKGLKTRDVKDRVLGPEKLRLTPDPAWNPQVVALITACFTDNPKERLTIAKAALVLDRLLGRPHHPLLPGDDKLFLLNKPPPATLSEASDGDDDDEPNPAHTPASAQQILMPSAKHSLPSTNHAHTKPKRSSK